MTLSCQPWQPKSIQWEYCLSFPAVRLHSCHCQIWSIVLCTCFIPFIVAALRRNKSLWGDNSQLSPETRKRIKKLWKWVLVALHHHTNLLKLTLGTCSLKWSAKKFPASLVKLQRERMNDLLLKCQSPWWLTDVICCTALVPQEFGTVGA